MQTLRFLALLLLVLPVAAEAKQDNCVDYFAGVARPPSKPKKEIKRAIEEARENLGMKTKIKVSKMDAEMTTKSGKKIGHLSFIITPRGALKIIHAGVKEKYRRNGVSEALLAKILKEHPEIVSVDAHTLVDTNEQVMLKALSQGLSCKEALKATPAYRMRARFGFTEITNYDCDDGAFTATRKP